MEKMTKLQKINRKDWLELVQDANGFVYSRKPHDDENGFCLVAVPCMPQVEDAKFYDVAFSWCAENDVFNRKIGEYIALERFMLCETTKMPGYVIDNLLEMGFEDDVVL